MNNNRHIYEGWHVHDFIEEIEVVFPYAKDRINSLDELKQFCIDNQPYYKKHIPEVFNHFKQQLCI